MKKRLIAYILILLLLLSVFGCGSDDSGKKSTTRVKKTVNKTKEVAKVPVVEAPKAEEKYIYNPIGKRDPFENPLQVIDEVAPGSGEPLTPLQKFDLGQLRLIGVIIGKGEPRGMVIAPDGKSFILTVGTKVGKNDGTVVDITTDAIIVKEKYYDFTGEIKTSVQQIMLPKAGGVK
ncbi:MAG: hypothetical protein C0623_00800 [Desulfuromonas sp.]|nr:MAG: hypothetical protein C0623_00800 [Desulfuromonas sp.]